MSKAGDRLGYLAYKIVSVPISLLPRPLCLAVGRSFGRLAFRLDRRHREIALDNLTLAFGREITPAERSVLARRAFIQLGRTLADILKATRYSPKRIRSLLDIEGRRHLESALAKGKGALPFTGHYGNWEFAAAGVSGIGRLRVIARALDNPFIERDLARVRAKFGAGIINKIGAARPILKSLGRNEMVAILIDLNVLRSGQPVFVDFFGKLAATTPVLAAFHLKTGAPLVPVFCVPAEKGRYRVKINEPLAIPLSGRSEEDVLKITQICTKIIEQEIRQRPEFWFWVHKRWNTRPAEEVTTR
jgi:KDO2-lipid IV(A) lauroyltransferase